MGTSNVELARRGFEAIAGGDVDAIAELLAPDVKWHGGDPSSGCINRDEALTWMRNAARRRRGALPELVDAIEAGDRVVVILQPPATAEDPSPRRVANLTTFRDGKIVEMVHYPDAAEALAAAGASGYAGASG